MKAAKNAAISRAGNAPTICAPTMVPRTSPGANRATMSQQGDPGYKATSVLLAESGLALALDRDKLSDLRGVLTPASAMGDVLLDRLPRAGVTLEVTRL